MSWGRGQPESTGGALRFERYDVVRHLGAGAMADVYEVEHRALSRRFALKLLRSDQAQKPRVVERFDQEARTLARLHGPHIVDVVDAGVDGGGRPYFVMELLEGSDLRAVLEREGPLPVRRALYLALDLCAALEVAHGAGIVHRDLKPENVFVTRDAQGRDVCKLLDFGVAKSQELDITRDGALIGTARYMAPEQFAGEGGVGPTSDLFALGVMLFECLAGFPPFDGDSMERILFRILNEPAPSLAAIRPELPAALVALVARALDKQSERRFGSAGELGAALRALLEPGSGMTPAQPTLSDEMPVPTVPPAPPAAPEAAAPRSFRGSVVGLALVAGVLLGVGLVRLIAPPPDTALHPAMVAPTNAKPAAAPPRVAPLPDPPTSRADSTPPQSKAASRASRRQQPPAPQTQPAPPEHAPRPPLFFPGSTP